jgi:hypothetical protein
MMPLDHAARHTGHLAIVAALSAFGCNTDGNAPEAALRTRQPLAERQIITGKGVEPQETPVPRAKKQKEHPLRSVAAIVEADIARTWYGYEDRLGPRTYFELSNVVVHGGRPLEKKVFSQLGGPLPDGRFSEVTELPDLSAGARYILFMGKTISVFTPIWARLAFRIEQVNGRKVVIGADGKAVKKISVNGIEFGKAELLDIPRERSMADKPRSIFLKKGIAEEEIDGAVSDAEFVANAVTAAIEADAPFGDVITELDPTARWDRIPTSPQ